ncbi:radical SAM protein [Nocardioides immobilis]|uniref:Radical SAM protein n=1 Tax=Nocardioides immobilis TaxID=2049295 RepID=A0A417XYH5_9ACTN|nr:4Fe-4S single cluster domain-containing protein [Nocardioides immobilis]RHW25417.1 radical SAM protein [Nocardioides immobilis]
MEPRRTVTLSRIVAPLTALGPGLRVGVWVQGCTIGCSGCASVDTWDPSGGSSLELAEAVDRVARALTDDITGITVTGGEPFQQAPAVAELLTRLREIDPLRNHDVLVFTGYTASRAERLGPGLWEQADALVCGPYLPGRGAGGWLRASDNQELVLRTRRGQHRFAVPAAPVVQVAANDGDVTLAGLPRSGDLDRFRQLMHARGIDFEEVSWQS